MHGVHCVSHRTNLAVKELSNLPVIAKIENLLQSLYSYFARSPKRHLEFTKLAAVMETKGLKIIRNIKTRWLSMVSPLKRVISEYRTLVQKMQEDSCDCTSTFASRESSRANLELLLDISVPVALTCFLPLLETVHYLVKFSQQRDVFICDYLAAVKVCQGQLYSLYSDPATSFRSDSFTEFNDLLACQNRTISLIWEPAALDLNEQGVEQLFYSCKGSRHPVMFLSSTGQPQRVSRDDFSMLVDDVKALCQGTFPKCCLWFLNVVHGC
jgi:hypothetical protein